MKYLYADGVNWDKQGQPYAYTTWEIGPFWAIWGLNSVDWLVNHRLIPWTLATPLFRLLFAFTRSEGQTIPL